MNNTATNLADALFALMEARKELDELDEHRGRGFRILERIRALREQAYALAADRYEAAVVESCRAAIPVREIVYTGGGLNP